MRTGRTYKTYKDFASKWTIKKLNRTDAQVSGNKYTVTRNGAAVKFCRTKTEAETFIRSMKK